MNMRIRTGSGWSRGISLVEMMITVAVIAILSAIAVPSFTTMSRNLECKKTARDVVIMLRKAKSDAITSNRGQRVQIVASSGQYGYSGGNTAYCGTACTWGSVTWTPLSSYVSFATTTNVFFTPNGAALAPVNITIQDTTGVPRYTVAVSTAGRISVN